MTSEIQSTQITSAAQVSQTAQASKERWVIKIGSALLTHEGKGLDRKSIENWVVEWVALVKSGREIVIVTSGSIAEGLARLNKSKRPETTHELQAAAAIGQMGLVQTYQKAFASYGVETAQVLLTHDDLSNRKRYLNAKSALKCLLDWGVVPIINENDTVVTDEIKFGDNDTLAGLVSNLVQADRLVIMTDQKGLYDADPRANPNAALVTTGDPDDEKLLQMAALTSGILGRGGMHTKIKAARLAKRSGTSTIICHGHSTNLFQALANGEAVGTLLQAGVAPVRAKKQWLLGQLQLRGSIQLDQGAAKALKAGKSILAVGIVGVSGSFSRGELVSIFDGDTVELARGLVNYSSDEIKGLKGLSSLCIIDTLGFSNGDEIIHRDNLALVQRSNSGA